MANLEVRTTVGITEDEKGDSAVNNGVKVFENAEFGKVRVVMKDDEPWFVAADVCKALGLIDPSKIVSGLDPDEKGLNFIRTHKGLQQMLIVSKPGLYSLLAASSKPEARKFKRWVNNEVLPAIEEYGANLSDDTVKSLLSLIQHMQTAVQHFADAVAKHSGMIMRLDEDAEGLKNNVNTDKPGAAYRGLPVDPDADCISISSLARKLWYLDCGISPNSLFKMLRRDGYANRRHDGRHAPSQKAIDEGLLTIGKKRGSSCPIIYVTVKGQEFFANLYSNDKKSAKKTRRDDLQRESDQPLLNISIFDPGESGGM